MNGGVSTGGDSTRTAIVVTGFAGQPTRTELARAAATGKGPRKDYVELARLLDADVIDAEYMASRAQPLARAVAASAGILRGEIAEAFLTRGRYPRIVVWHDRVGLALAGLCKLTGSRRDIVLVSVRLSNSWKGFALQHLRVHTHLAAIVHYGSVQMGIAERELHVPAEKLHLLRQPVDERFWRSEAEPSGGAFCSVGHNSRDYETLVRALDGTDLRGEVALGSIVPSSRAPGQPRPSTNLTVRSDLGAPALRELYARSSFVVVPLLDVDFDAGVSVLTEAMAMGKAVIVTRTRGQVDIVREGENGLYVPPGDHEALRAAIARLTANPEEAARMGRAGRALVERSHTLHGYVERLAAIARS